MRKIIEPHMSRFFFSQGCKIAQCLMSCTRTKYNMMCEGTAGSLLLEMLTLPLSPSESSSTSFLSATHLTSFLGGLLPHTCAFLTAREGKRESFRIDPDLDKEIKRMYSDKNRSNSVTLPSSLSQPIEVENPFLQLSNVFHQASPFDNPEANEQLLENGALFRNDDHPEESSGSIDVPSSRSAADEEYSATSPTTSSPSMAEQEIFFDMDKSKPSYGHQVEAGTKYTVHVTRQPDIEDIAQGEALQEESSSALFEEGSLTTEEWSGSGEPDSLEFEY
ncbi:hypothetical protein COOONC_08634 [Cooperia oncophora]